MTMTVKSEDHELMVWVSVTMMAETTSLWCGYQWRWWIRPWVYGGGISDNDGEEWIPGVYGVGISDNDGEDHKFMVGVLVTMMVKTSARPKMGLLKTIQRLKMTINFNQRPEDREPKTKDRRCALAKMILQIKRIFKLDFLRN